MCFSAGASFGVSAVLIVAGIATIKQTKYPSQIPFALIPLLFGIQQFIEGFLWLSLTKDNYSDFHEPTTYIFLVFAQVVWPALVPYSIWRLETDKFRKRILLYLTFIGLFISVYVIYCLFNFSVDSLISGSHIRYDMEYQYNFFRFSGLLYFVPTVIPSFVSSKKYMFVFGLLILTSFVVTKVFYEEYIVSIWCYFAAAISLTIFFLIKGFNKKKVEVE